MTMTVNVLDQEHFVRDTINKSVLLYVIYSELYCKTVIATSEKDLRLQINNLPKSYIGLEI